MIASFRPTVVPRFLGAYPSSFDPRPWGHVNLAILGKGCKKPSEGHFWSGIKDQVRPLEVEGEELCIGAKTYKGLGKKNNRNPLRWTRTTKQLERYQRAARKQNVAMTRQRRVQCYPAVNTHFKPLKRTTKGWSTALNRQYITDQEFSPSFRPSTASGCSTEADFEEHPQLFSKNEGFFSKPHGV